MNNLKKVKTIKFVILSFIINGITLSDLLYNGVITWLIFTFFAIVVVLLHFLVALHFYQVNKQFSYLNHVIESILTGELDTLVKINDYIHYPRLNANLSRLAKRMTKLTYKKEEDEQTIKNLTNNITSPIIYIDCGGRIRYVNNDFVNQFQVSVEVNDIYEKLRIQSLYNFIDNAFVFESKEVSTLQIDENYYQANAIPISSNQMKGLEFAGILFIFHDITEIKKYENLQKEFLANASHELKTPLSAIKGASEILLNGEKHSKEMINEFLQMIKNENDRMERIVRDILLISRLERENILIKKDNIDVKQLLVSTIEIIAYKAQAKNQSIIQDIESDLFIVGDFERLKHAFLNLISNAISYTNIDQSIYVTAYQDLNKVFVSIKDEGIGMEDNELPYIFERFYRIDKARSRDTGGTGLGLAIVKSTMDIHNAEIEVKSQIDKGTEFLIIFNKNR